MPGALPKSDNTFLWSVHEVKPLTDFTSIYITGFETNADIAKIDHTDLYSCHKLVDKPGKSYDYQPCIDFTYMMFSWAENAPPTTLPLGVSFEISRNKREYLID